MFQESSLLFPSLPSINNFFFDAAAAGSVYGIRARVRAAGVCVCVGVYVCVSVSVCARVWVTECACAKWKEKE